MPRPRKPYWHDRDRCYKSRIGGREEILRNRDGTKVAHDDQRGAREAIDRLLAEYDAEVRRVADPNVADLCSAYLVAVAKDLEAETLYGKEWVLTQWCQFGAPPHGERVARQIDATDLNRMGKAWIKAGYSGSMIRRLYREVMACWAWAARPEPERVPIRILEDNPLAGMRLPKNSPHKDKYVAVKVLRTLIAFAESRAAGWTPLKAHFERQTILMLRLLVETGCRPKEACAAKWTDFEADTNLIILQAHKTAKKTGKPRVIVVPLELGAELIALGRSGHSHPVHIFAHKRGFGHTSAGAERETGAPWTRPGFTAWFRELVRAARKEGLGLPPGVTLYWLRHSYLTDAQMELDSEKAANLAGNTKELARDAYLHLQREQLRKDHTQVTRSREPT